MYDITCPVTEIPIAHYKDGDRIDIIVSEHMSEVHPQWYKTSYLLWSTQAPLNCNHCTKVCVGQRGLGIHMRKLHPKEAFMEGYCDE